MLSLSLDLPLDLSATRGRQSGPRSLCTPNYLIRVLHAVGACSPTFQFRLQRRHLAGPVSFPSQSGSHGERGNACLQQGCGKEIATLLELSSPSSRMEGQVVDLIDSHIDPLRRIVVALDQWCVFLGLRRVSRPNPTPCRIKIQRAQYVVAHVLVPLVSLPDIHKFPSVDFLAVNRSIRPDSVEFSFRRPRRFH